MASEFTPIPKPADFPSVDLQEATVPSTSVNQPSPQPTRKWIVTQITAAAALLTMWVTTGSWDVEETVGLIGLLSQAAISYATPARSTDADAPGNS